jgi:oxalate decarboxylase/phosphoglucose isomerase-like protein (cupin superfamily)
MNTLEKLSKSFQATAYYHWMKEEGIPVIEDYGIEDVRRVELSPWRRTGGMGAFICLYGMEGTTGMYVAEIPPGGTLEPEKHLYEEVICILNGYGATEVWQENGNKQTFEWGPYTVFAPPLNTWHRLINGSSEAVKFFAVTTAPIIIDIYRDANFVFDSPYEFRQRFGGQQRYFEEGQNRYIKGPDPLWETNILTNVATAKLDAKEVKGPSVKTTQFEIAGNSLVGHIAEWPQGMYNKAHYHQPGAILLILRSEGYTLLWPKEAGIRPYEEGREKEVVKLRWSEGSVISPPGGWFHQHFCTGKDPVRQLALKMMSRLYPIAFKVAGQKYQGGIFNSIREGGTMIEYEDEDPEIRRRFEAELKKTGGRSQMPELGSLSVEF